MNLACLVLWRSIRMLKSMAMEPPIAAIKSRVRSLVSREPAFAACLLCAVISMANKLMMPK